jgi:hypothetical protein
MPEIYQDSTDHSPWLHLGHIDLQITVYFKFSDNIYKTNAKLHTMPSHDRAGKPKNLLGHYNFRGDTFNIPSLQLLN